MECALQGNSVGRLQFNASNIPVRFALSAPGFIGSQQNLCLLARTCEQSNESSRLRDAVVLWNEEVAFRTIRATSDLRVGVYARMRIGSDAFLGATLFPALPATCAVVAVLPTTSLGWFFSVAQLNSGRDLGGLQSQRDTPSTHIQFSFSAV